MGLSITRHQAVAKAVQIAKGDEHKKPFKNGIPGKECVQGFIMRTQTCSFALLCP